MQDAANVTNTANSFRDCLRGASKALFHDILTTPITYATFQVDVWTLTEMILGPAAVKDQLAYLRRTLKPSDKIMEQWLQRIEAINALLPYMENNTHKRSNSKLAEEVIIPNLPSYLRVEFELTYHPGDSISRIIRCLKLIANKTKKVFEAAKTTQHNR